MELCQGGSLSTCKTQFPNLKVPTELTWRIAHEVGAPPFRNHSPSFECAQRCPIIAGTLRIGAKRHVHIGNAAPGHQTREHLPRCSGHFHLHVQNRGLWTRGALPRPFGPSPVDRSVRASLCDCRRSAKKPPEISIEAACVRTTERTSAFARQVLVTERNWEDGDGKYVAPELLCDDTEPTSAADIYSFGATLYECVTGTHPPRTPSTIAFPPETPLQLRNLIQWMLATDPHKRPTAEEVLVEVAPHYHPSPVSRCKVRPRLARLCDSPIPDLSPARRSPATSRRGAGAGPLSSRTDARRVSIVVSCDCRNSELKLTGRYPPLCLWQLSNLSNPASPDFGDKIDSYLQCYYSPSSGSPLSAPHDSSQDMGDSTYDGFGSPMDDDCQVSTVGKRAECTRMHG
eukprot:178152-Prorocentrum_minimum.AAC.3